MGSFVNPNAFTNAFNTQVQLGMQRRQADQAEEMNALAMEQARGQLDEQKRAAMVNAFPRIGTIAAQISTLGDPAQKRLAFKNAIVANGADFDALGMPHTDALAKLEQTDDATLEATLAKLAEYAPKSGPVKVGKDDRLVRPGADGKYETVLDAVQSPESADNNFAKVDPSNYTRESIAVFQKSGNYGDLVPLEKPDPNASNNTFNHENTLRDEYTKNTQQHAELLNSFETLKTLGANGSPAGDIAMVAAFMRAVDPGSRVTGAEQATAENSGGVPAVIRSYYNQLLGKGQLSETQRADFMSQAENLVNGRARAYKGQREKYGGLAKRYGLNPANVIGDELTISGSVKQPPKLNAKGWKLKVDDQGNKAYVSPDGSQFEEVK